MSAVRPRRGSSLALCSAGNSSRIAALVCSFSNCLTPLDIAVARMKKINKRRTINNLLSVFVCYNNSIAAWDCEGVQNGRE